MKNDHNIQITFKAKWLGKSSHPMEHLGFRFVDTMYLSLGKPFSLLNWNQACGVLPIGIFLATSLVV